LAILPDDCDVVITSRQTRFAMGIADRRFNVYELAQMDPDDAHTFLQKRLSAPPALRPQLEQIAQALGYHALALDMAATTLSTKPINNVNLDKFMRPS
jgi:hypothetical protein